MRKRIFSLVCIIYVLLLTSCSNDVKQIELSTANSIESSSGLDKSELDKVVTIEMGEEAMETNLSSITMQVNGKNFQILMYNNESAHTFMEQLPLALTMEDYASQEKVTSLPFSVKPAQTQTPPSVNAGELYLWSGTNLVLFYETFSNSYSYVPLGYIEDVSELEEALGKGSVQVTFQE